MQGKTSMMRRVRALATGITMAVAIAIPFHAQAVGSTPVTVVNAAELAKAMGVQHPFQVQMTCAATNSDASCTNRYPVPPDQRLVIEYVSLQCSNDWNARLIFARLWTSTDGTHFIGHYLNLGSSADPAGSMAQVGHVVKLYAAPGSQIMFDAIADASSPHCVVVLSGQAIDVP